MGAAVRYQPSRPLRSRVCAARRARCRPFRSHRGRQLVGPPLLTRRLRRPAFRFRRYDPLLAYGQSKTAVILFAVGATARWAADGITANALNPGAIATNLQRHVGGKLVTPPERQKTSEQGAATSVLLATLPDLEGIGGRYFDDCNEAPTVDHRDATGIGVASYALDPANAQRLWEVSEALLDHA
jgi:NAD(P)-dependent dehydrogenase (short-subunit alcohol dehydrogenase family)